MRVGTDFITQQGIEQELTQQSVVSWRGRTGGGKYTQRKRQGDGGKRQRVRRGGQIRGLTEAYMGGLPCLPSVPVLHIPTRKAEPARTK